MSYKMPKGSFPCSWVYEGVPCGDEALFYVLDPKKTLHIHDRALQVSCELPAHETAYLCLSHWEGAGIPAFPLERLFILMAEESLKHVGD